MAVGRSGQARGATRISWPGVFIFLFTCSLLALTVGLAPAAAATGGTDVTVTNDQLVDDIISTLQFGRPSSRGTGGFGDALWLEDEIAEVKTLQVPLTFPPTRGVSQELRSKLVTQINSLEDIENAFSSIGYQHGVEAVANAAEKLKNTLEQIDDGKFTDDSQVMEEIISILEELKTQLEAGQCVSCDELLINLGEEHLCIALELMDLDPRLCCRKAREHCDNDCCQDKLTQVLALLNPENRKLQADDLLMVLLILGVSTDDINPQRMLLALEYLNQVRFERWVLCRINQYCDTRAAHPQLYPGWAGKPLPVQVIEAAASLGVVPHDIPRRLVYPMLAAGNFSNQDQENLLTIYTETMDKKAEADVAEVVYLLFTYRPERRKDLWSSFERQFKMFSSALGTSLDIENAALSFYGGDFGLGVVAETVKTAAEKVDMAKLLQEDSLVPKLKTMELAAKDEVFVAAVFSLAKREDQAKTYYWTAGMPSEYQPLDSKGLAGKSITGVNVRNGRNEIIGAALIEYDAKKDKELLIDHFQIYLNQSYNLMPMTAGKQPNPCPNEQYKLIHVDFDAKLVGAV